MGGSEGSNSGSGDDGGRSGYDVTRTDPIITFTKVEFFMAFGIIMVRCLFIPFPAFASFQVHEVDLEYPCGREQDQVMREVILATKWKSDSLRTRH